MTTRECAGCRRNRTPRCDIRALRKWRSGRDREWISELSPQTDHCARGPARAPKRTSESSARCGAKWHGSWKLKAAIEKTCGYLGRESDGGSSTSHASRFPCVIEAAKRTTGSRTHVCDLVDANDPKRSKGRIAIPHFIGRVRVQWSDALFLWRLTRAASSATAAAMSPAARSRRDRRTSLTHRSRLVEIKSTEYFRNLLLSLLLGEP